jgi:MYXO-CTERM domain-containing protein
VTENGVVKCAPEGNVPVCVCKGAQVGCQSPCYGVTCSSGLGCVEKGPAVGSCQPLDNCNYFPCSSGLACHDGKCIDDPCDPNPCPTDQVCKPADSTLATHKCVGSCASVTCGSAEMCVDGKCVPTGCAQPCPAGEICHPGDGGGFCWPSNCGGDGGTVCTQGLYCDPVTGQCGDDPCTAVHCPGAQVCKAGECYWAPEAGTDGGGGSGGSATDGGGGSGATDGGTKEEPSGIWKLATGGGCACRAAGTRSDGGWLAAGLLAAITALRRRRPRRTRGGAR